MIQLEEWIAIVTALTLLLLSIAYLIYFKISKKLFPQTIDFSSEIKPNEGTIVCKVEGSGIIKVIELKTNENCIIAITIDGIIHTLLSVGPELGSKIPSKLNEDVLAVREQLDEKFCSNCTIHIQNRGAGVLHTNGNINFEIKRGLKATFRAIFSELK